MDLSTKLYPRDVVKRYGAGRRYKLMEAKGYFKELVNWSCDELPQSPVW